MTLKSRIESLEKRLPLRVAELSPEEIEQLERDICAPYGVAKLDYLTDDQLLELLRNYDPNNQNTSP